MTASGMWMDIEGKQTRSTVWEIVSTVARDTKGFHSHNAMLYKVLGRVQCITNGTFFLAEDFAFCLLEKEK